MQNFISENIAYLIKKNNLSLDDFGSFFELSKGLTGQYVRKLALPKIITIQKICEHYNISIDDFINLDLSAPKVYGIKQGELLYAHEPTIDDPEFISPRFVKSLIKTIKEKEQIIIDKQKIIQMLEEKLEPKEIPSDQARDGNKIIDEIENIGEKKSVK